MRKESLTFKRDFKHYFLFSIMCFLVIYTYSSSAGVGSLCSRMFFNKKASAFAGLECNDPRGKVLLEAHRTAERLQMFIGNKEVREFEKGLRRMAEFLERPPTGKEQEILNHFNTSIEASVNKIPEMMEFVQNVHPTKAPYFGRITEAVLAMFSKHIPTMLKEDANQIDLPRINLILKSIAAFDANRPEFSLYKIKRAIEGRYSLREFILCRV